MPIDTAVVGSSTDPITHQIDDRWIMAYSAGLNDLNTRYMDTDTHALTAHPVFPVCLEWPTILSSRALPGYDQTTPDELARGVHAAHDLHLYRPIQAGDHLTTTATVTHLEQIKPGVAVTTRLDTIDDQGNLVCQTYQLGIHRGVDMTGTPTHSQPPPLPPIHPGNSNNPRATIPVSANAAHIYTECARIWNPIHTDRAVALAAGLPDIILHGTATLALAISHLVNRHLDGDSTRVKRLGGRFSAMVLMPSELNLVVDSQTEGLICFTVYTTDGQAAFSRGFLCFE